MIFFFSANVLILSAMGILHDWQERPPTAIAKCLSPQPDASAVYTRMSEKHYPKGPKCLTILCFVFPRFEIINIILGRYLIVGYLDL